MLRIVSKYALGGSVRNSHVIRASANAGEGSSYCVPGYSIGFSPMGFSETKSPPSSIRSRYGSSLFPKASCGKGEDVPELPSGTHSLTLGPEMYLEIAYTHRVLTIQNRADELLSYIRTEWICSHSARLILDRQFEVGRRHSSRHTAVEKFISSLRKRADLSAARL
jgi:hypothetical protein